MAEPTPLSSFFFQNDPNINAELRKRIALQMMASQGKFPKTIGEGLSAIGDAIGDRGIAYQLGQQDLAMQGLNPPAAGTQASSYGDVHIKDEPGVQAINAASGPSISPVAPTAIAQQPRPASLPPAQNQVVAPGATPEEGGFNELDAAGAADPTFARQRAIGGIETGGARNPYATLGAVTRSGDRAYGKYQVMGANIGPWTQAALGRSLTPQQFLADRDAQDATFNKQFGDYANKYGEEGAAKAWYAGERGMNNPNATDQHGRLTVAGYGQDYINRLGGGDPRAAITAQMMALAPTGAGGGPGGQPAQPAPAQVAQAQLQPRNPQRTVNDIQPAPAQQQYPAGYVPPAAARPQGAPVIQPTPREVELSTWAAQQAARGNPYAAAKVAAELGALQKNREIRQNEANEWYKSEITQGAEQNKLRTQGQMDQQKRQADVAKTQQEIAVGNSKIVDGRLIEKGEDGKWRDVTPDPAGTTPGGPPNVKMTAEQSKSQKFHGWTSLAEEQMQGKENLLATGLQQEIAGKIPFVGNKVQSAEYRRVRGAAERFVQGFLRDVSGAVISPEEMQKHQATFLPKYGDDPRTIADKKAARDQIINGLYAGAGPGRAISDWETKQRTEKGAVEQAKIDDEMKGLPKVRGKHYDNPDRPGHYRIWTGSRWEEY